MTTELPRMTCNQISQRYDLERSAKGHKHGMTHNLADSNLLSVRLLFYRIVEDNVQEDLEAHVSCADSSSDVAKPEMTYIVSTENANNLAATVQLNEEATVKVL